MREPIADDCALAGVEKVTRVLFLLLVFVRVRAPIAYVLARWILIIGYLVVLVRIKYRLETVVRIRPGGRLPESFCNS